MRVIAVVSVSIVLVGATSPRAGAAELGGALVVADPGGALGEEASVAGGLAGHALWKTHSGTVGLRLDGSWLLYGTETVRIPVAGTAGRIVREVTTDNWAAQLGAGPQVVLPLGKVRPYLNAFAGLSYLSTTSHLRDPIGHFSADSTNYDDTAFAYGGGGGLLVALGGQGKSLDLGVRYVRTDSVKFLAEGDVGNEGGLSGVRAHHGQANLLEFRVGLAFSSPSSSAPAGSRPAAH
jgi:hypothetical protein